MRRQYFKKGLRLSEGDHFRYTSVLASESYDPHEGIPAGIQVVLKGTSAFGVSVANVFIVTFTNVCGVRPFFKHDQIGWCVFVSVIQ